MNKLLPFERETIILWSDAENMASVMTYDKKLIRRLDTLASKHREFIVESEHQDERHYLIPKRCVRIQVYDRLSSMSDQQRQEMASRMREMNKSKKGEANDG